MQIMRMNKLKIISNEYSIQILWDLHPTAKPSKVTNKINVSLKTVNLNIVSSGFLWSKPSKLYVCDNDMM